MCEPLLAVSALTRMTSNPGGDDQPGDYSPNGKRLVFARFDHPTDPDGLFTVKVERTGCARSRHWHDPRADSGGNWSPQGNQIVFARHIAADRRTTLWVVHTDGSARITRRARLPRPRGRRRPR
jgi:Tol biopolymer transport system component